VTIAAWNQKWRWPFLLIACIFVYTTLTNIWERPEGLKISSFFILTIISVSLISRAMRSTELRIVGIELSKSALEMLAEDEDQVIRVIARKPQSETKRDLDCVDAVIRERYNLDPRECLYFFEVERGDASDFEEKVFVDARRVGNNKVLFVRSPAVANSIAALLIDLERRTGKLPHVYFTWTEGNPVINVIRFIFLGEGDTAPITHEVLRRAIPDMRHRPIVHVG
jgi:hypothetical protein